jgi:hypothetical protein
LRMRLTRAHARGGEERPKKFCAIQKSQRSLIISLG